MNRPKRRLCRLYHEFVADQGSRFTPPDLAIAFNSRCGQDYEYITAWRYTIELLVSKRIPSVFTVSRPRSLRRLEHTLMS